MQKADAPAGASALLLLIIAFVAACWQHMAAGAFFVTGKGAGLAGSSAHDHKYFHPLAAIGAFYLG